MELSCRLKLSVLELNSQHSTEKVRLLHKLVGTKLKVSADASTRTEDPSDFRNLTSALQYLTFTQPDISYVVQQVCLHMHDPWEPRLTALKHILRNIRGTLNLGLVLHPSSQSKVVVYSDAHWVGCPNTRKSTSGYAVFLGNNFITWSSKLQAIVSRSSVEVEYRTVASAVSEATLVALASARAPHWNKS